MVKNMKDRHGYNREKILPQQINKREVLVDFFTVVETLCRINLLFICVTLRKSVSYSLYKKESRRVIIKAYDNVKNFFFIL